jgi:ferritin
MFSAYLYMAMSTKMTGAGYTGIAKWLMVQYHEEMFHAMKFVKYLEDQGAAPKLAAIETPNVPETGVKELFEHVLKHEQFVTSSIREIVDLAIAEKDFATQNLLTWYINEQVEEEKNDSEILQAIALLGNSAQGLYMLNVELGKRENEAALDFTKI